MEVYGDLVNDPTFADAELKPMKDRMAAAIAGEDADWTAQASRFFKKEFYGPLNSQYAIVGTERNLKSFTADQVSGWYHKDETPVVIIQVAWGGWDGVFNAPVPAYNREDQQ